MRFKCSSLAHGYIILLFPETVSVVSDCSKFWILCNLRKVKKTWNPNREKKINFLER